MYGSGFDYKELDLSEIEFERLLYFLVRHNIKTRREHLNNKTSKDKTLSILFLHTGGQFDMIRPVPAPMYMLKCWIPSLNICFYNFFHKHYYTNKYNNWI